MDVEFKITNFGCKFPEALSISVPLTAFASAEATATCAGVKEQVRLYRDYDDVFEEFFLKAVYIHGSEKHEAGLLPCLKEAYGTEILFSNIRTSEAVTVEPASSVPNGPYLAQISETEAFLGPVYRVHYDENMAFMNGLLPNGTSGNAFKYATVNTLSDSTIAVPVPSRLYSKDAATAKKPLAGFRVAVKDIIDIKGIKTSNGNRAWFKLYDAVNASAPAIQRPVDLGVSIIGKPRQRSLQTQIDQPQIGLTINGYQDPGVSSAGSGAATASYDWVDVAIGTDTGGSIRIPAGKNGVFGLRPSFGALSNKGFMEEGEFFDSVGFHTRSPYMLQSFGKKWLAASATNNHIRPAVFDVWIEKLATFLNATVESSSIDEYWNATAHADNPGTDFWSHMRMVGFNLIWKNQLEKVIKRFRASYEAAFGGRSPFINPFPAARYESAINVTQEDYNIAYEKFTYFRNWFGKEVVKPDSNSCSESLFVIPMATGDTAYRNNIYSPPNVGT
ncbi:amidase signature domain-containing protein [Aspergillus spectabilis]